MSSRYTNDGKRRSSQTHAGKAHTCDLCDAALADGWLSGPSFQESVKARLALIPDDFGGEQRLDVLGINFEQVKP